MNAGTIAERPAAVVGNGAGRRRRARAAALVPALAATALLTAACSGGPAGSSGAGQLRLAKALAFAHCMRSHGAPDFPDPNSSGVWMVNPSDSSRFDAPQSTRAATRGVAQGRRPQPLPTAAAGRPAIVPAFMICLLRSRTW